MIPGLPGNAQPDLETAATAGPPASVSPASDVALVADIGGTRARFALAEGDVIRDEAELAVADFADPAAALAAYAERIGRPKVRAAVLAIAAPVGASGRDEPVLTNGTWRFRRAAVASVMDVPVTQVRLLNDFHALALSLPALTSDESRPIGGGLATPDATVAVIGPGTGLGVAGLVRNSTGWTAVSGEGGHATLAPGDERESEILRLARCRFDHVSAERLLSGTGLPLLHELVSEVDGRPVAPAGSADIVAGALAGDAACGATVDTFCAWLGSVAGNVALCFGARGGVYLGGGILPRLGTLLDRSAFRARFEAKGRSTGYLAAVPTRVILCPAPALRGAARMAADIPDTSAR
jgi:glucokinase